MSMNPPTTTLACWCSGTDDSLLAVLDLDRVTALDLLAKQADFRSLQATRPGLSWTEYVDYLVRFFDNVWNDDEDAVEALFAAVDDTYDDSDWFPIDPALVPAQGDYRTSYVLLRVSDLFLCVQGQGKHSDAVFETADISEAMLRAAAGLVEEPT